MIECEEREEEPGPEPGRDRAIRLFEYLRRLAELRTPTVRDVAAYPEVVWFGEVPAEPECRVVTRVPPAGPLQWLTIDRPRRSPPPELPTARAARRAAGLGGRARAGRLLQPAGAARHRRGGGG